MFGRHLQQDAACHKAGTSWYVYLITIVCVLTVLTFIQFTAVTMSPKVQAAEAKTTHVSQANAHGYPKHLNGMGELHYYSKGEYFFRGNPHRWETVTYRWRHSDGSAGREYQVQIHGNTWAKAYEDDWKLPTNLPNGTHYTWLQFTTPNYYISSVTSFRLDCPKPLVTNVGVSADPRSYYGQRKPLNVTVTAYFKLQPNHTGQKVFIRLIPPSDKPVMQHAVDVPAGRESQWAFQKFVIHYNGHDADGIKTVRAEILYPNYLISSIEYYKIHWTN